MVFSQKEYLRSKNTKMKSKMKPFKTKLVYSQVN